MPRPPTCPVPIPNHLTLETTLGKEGDVWVGMAKEGLFHSTDSGVKFTKIAGIESVDFMAAGRQVYGRVFFGTGGNGFLSGEIDPSAAAR